MVDQVRRLAKAEMFVSQPNTFADPDDTDMYANKEKEAVDSTHHSGTPLGDQSAWGRSLLQSAEFYLFVHHSSICGAWPSCARAYKYREPM